LAKGAIGENCQSVCNVFVNGHSTDTYLGMAAFHFYCFSMVPVPHLGDLESRSSTLLTLVDKATKSAIIRKLPDKRAETVAAAFQNIVNNTLYEFKTITSDNGTEFALHDEIAKVTGAAFYFARPYHSWERGLNEHTNGLIRRFYPKGTDFNQVNDEDIAQIEHILNTRGRASLGYKSPNDVFLEHLLVA